MWGQWGSWEKVWCLMGWLGTRGGGLVGEYGWWGDWGQVEVSWLEPRGAVVVWGPRCGGDLQIVVLLKKECSFNGGDV